MSKLFYHVAGHKPTAQKQLCCFNPTPFSQYRTEGRGRLSPGRAFTAHISKVPWKGVEHILKIDRKKKPQSLYSLDLSASGTSWCSSRNGLNASNQEDAFSCELKSSVGEPVVQDEFYECQIVRNSLQNQSLNQLPQGSLPLLYVSSAAEWNSNKFPSVTLCSVEILMLIASSCLGWGSLWGLDFCLETQAYFNERVLSSYWKHVWGRNMYMLRVSGHNSLKCFIV